jgi:hypothetical protein
MMERQFEIVALKRGKSDAQDKTDLK